MVDDQWFLEAVFDKGKRWIVKMDKFPFVIGRDEACQLTLSSTIVSREHAKIVRFNDVFYLDDLQSTNGTLLNGRKITEKSRLQESDIINICDFKFKLVCIENEEDKSGTQLRDLDAPIDTFSTKYNISPRESEVLSYLVKGDSTKKIADHMFISTGTAKNHILTIFKKTGTHSRIELSTLYNSFG